MSVGILVEAGTPECGHPHNVWCLCFKLNHLRNKGKLLIELGSIKVPEIARIEK